MTMEEATREIEALEEEKEGLERKLRSTERKVGDLQRELDDEHNVTKALRDAVNELHDKLEDRRHTVEGLSVRDQISLARRLVSRVGCSSALALLGADVVRLGL